jgi:Heterokaryon incompatibility protein (HET)
MRLLELQKDGLISLTEDFHDNIPPYAILSHTWGADDEELTFKEVVEGSGLQKTQKVMFCGRQAARDDIHYFWVDTCCIDKSNSTELGEAINSMFRWYRDAAKCYVYLSDVSTESVDNIAKGDHSEATWESAFSKSRWFNRGWTLQELLAPRSVEFFSVEGYRLGDKESLGNQIHVITRIPAEALRGITALSSFSIDERMSWAANRKTKRKEDEAYCLLGIFNIYMTFMYGEEENAMVRLRRKISKSLPGLQPKQVIHSTVIFSFSRTSLMY